MHKLLIFTLLLGSAITCGSEPNNQISQITDYQRGPASKLCTKQIDGKNNNVERPPVAIAGLANINEPLLGRARAIKARLVRMGAYEKQQAS